METGNQVVAINALVVAMESMLEEITAHEGDLMSLDSEELTKVQTIRKALETGVKHCNQFLDDGDFNHITEAGRQLVEAQKMVGDFT